MARKLFAAVFVFFFFGMMLPANAGAQFGKNRVQWRKLDWKYYQSQHFAIRHYFDLNDSKQKENLRKLVELLEEHYAWMSSPEVFDFEVKEPLPVIVFETHSDLEGNPLANTFLPEGVGAFVDWARVRMVAKQDFEPQLLQRIIVHELAHQFQIKMAKGSVIGKFLGLQSVPGGFVEGGAEYIASLRLPHTRDDIRDRQMRMMGSDIHLMPSWEALMSDNVNGYVAWKMVYDFLDAEIGPGTGVKFHMQGLKGKDLGLLIYELSKGRLGNPNRVSEFFNQSFFDHYNELYEKDRALRPQPYSDTANFRGRNITPFNHPYPMLSPALSPDGKRIACFTIEKYGVALVTFPIADEIPYVEPAEEVRNRDSIGNGRREKKVVINLTPQMVPIPYEELITPFSTWPKNGSHLAWSRDGRIAFFARTGRDHMLYVIDDKEGKILLKVPLEQDQGFSPKFSPDGKKIYFSASVHATYDIFSVDLESLKVENLTEDYRYDTAPDISPDGTKLVYVGNDGDFNHLFLLDLNDGSKRQLTFGRYNDISPSWSDSGNKIVFSSDEADKIFNLYTLDFRSNTRSAWLSLFGGVETPIFARNSENTVYYVAYRNNDTFRGYVYPNYEIFEAKLKQPITTDGIVNNNDSNVSSFNSDEFIDLQLDPNQVNVPRKPPEDWVFEGSDFYLGSATYWGIFASSYIRVSNLMETKNHMVQFASYSSLFRVANYTYLNREGRMDKGFSFAFNRYPLYYRFYDTTERRPKGSSLLNFAYWQETGGTAFANYPLSKWTRFEFMAGVRNIKFDMQGLSPEVLEELSVNFNDADKQLLPLMSRANGTSLLAGVSVVRDTVVGSGYAQGPLHGNAFRVDFLAAPPMGNTLKGYMSASAEARIYRRLGLGTLIALRGEAKTTNRESGEIIVAGGSDRFRGREWGSILGNELVYGSAELRFPLVDGIILPFGMGIGPFRGLLFADTGISKFRGENFPAQKITTYGTGVEFKPFRVIWAKQPNGSFAPSFYYTFGW